MSRCPFCTQSNTIDGGATEIGGPSSPVQPASAAAQSAAMSRTRSRTMPRLAGPVQNGPPAPHGPILDDTGQRNVRVERDIAQRRRAAARHGAPGDTVVVLDRSTGTD